jgi:predicted Zn finger-like uncharacterized protein
MTVTCPQCRATLSISDDRLPTGKAFKAACPRCGTAIAIDTRRASAPPTPVAAPESPVEPPAEPISYGERGQPQALERLRVTAYAVVVVREGFDGAAGSASSLSATLAATPMGSRRNTHLVFVGPSVASHDSRAAFAKSVDLTIHPSDLPHFADALTRSLAETEQMYWVFRETHRTLGRG